MRKWLVFVGGVLFLGLMVWLPFVWDTPPTPSGRTAPLRPKKFKKVLAEDVRVSRYGIYGVDLIRCGSCRVEKRRQGPFTLGGFNVLVLEDLSVIVPGKTAFGEPAVSGEKGDPATTSRDVAAALGLSDGFLKSRGLMPKFSGLRVERLSVARLDAATNVVPLFVAVSGEAKSDGLHLKQCAIIRSCHTNIVGNALLQVKPSLGLRWSSGFLGL